MGHEKFIESLDALERLVAKARNELADAQDRLQRVARAAHVAGMTEREIARAARRSGPAVHAWLHARDSATAGSVSD